VLGTADARGRDDNVRQWIGLVVGDGLVHWFPIISAVRHHGGDRTLDCPEQRRHLARVIRGVVGQAAGDDFAGIGINGEVQLAPGTACPTVLLLVPLAFQTA